MKVEHEVRVLEINKQKLIKKIKSLNGKFKGEYNQKRRIYDFNPKIHDKWIRLRTDGNKTTLAIKQVANRGIDGTKELEIDVSSFDDTNKILNELGYASYAFQENKRIRYVLNGVELDIDEWPMIPPHLEIEGKSDEEVNEMIRLLELNQEKVTPLSVQDIYKDVYGIDITTIEELKF